MNRLATAIVVAMNFFACNLLAEKPNVVVILADDLGYSDLGCYGGEVRTPNLDRLAAEGVRMTRFHNGGMCVVSRASMLTGQWWPQALKNFNQTPLVSEQLQSLGYRTALIGKWHLAGHPMDHGFDHFFGFLTGFADHFAGTKSYRLDREPFNNFGNNFYSSDVLTDRAIEFIQGRENGQINDPYFVCLSFQAPHNPLQAPRSDIMRYRGRYRGGWESIRRDRFVRQQELGIVANSTTLPDYPNNLPRWDSLTPAQQDLEDLRMSVYAAMVDRMDVGIGRLMDAIRERDDADNTMVIFISDNGTDSFSVVDQQMLAKGRLPGDRDSNWQPGTGWAYASVTPWRLYKISQHGGGITSGGIVWWPGQLGEPGRIEREPVHFIDVLPTILDLAIGDEPNPATPSILADRPQSDGTSLVPLWRGEDFERATALFFQYVDNRAIRTSDWTLAEVDGSGWELFNLKTDPTETTDLARENPAVVQQLQAKWLQWWKQQTGADQYTPKSTQDSPHYRPQGDRGSGERYVPSAMPKVLSGKYPMPAMSE